MTANTNEWTIKVQSKPCIDFADTHVYRSL